MNQAKEKASKRSLSLSLIRRAFHRYLNSDGIINFSTRVRGHHLSLFFFLNNQQKALDITYSFVCKTLTRKELIVSQNVFFLIEMNLCLSPRANQTYA